MQKLLWLCLLSTFTANFSHSQAESSAQQLYQEGLGLYQKQNWEEAESRWSKALQIEPDNPYILYNLGLVKSRSGQNSLALAYLRKTISLKPGLEEAYLAIKQIAPKIGQPASEKASLFSRPWLFFQRLLPKSLSYFLAIGACALFCWFLFEFISKRRASQKENLPPPIFPPVLWISGILIILFSTTSLFQLIYPLKPKGTIIIKEVFAKSSPSIEATDLFQLPEGSEVILERTETDWVQTHLPGGLRGWVQQKNIYQTDGDKLW